MELDSLWQLGVLLRATGLGWALGLLYDLLRAVRLRCGRSALRSALDALYGLALFLLVFFFTLRVGGGELRLFLLAGLSLGALSFFLLCSAALRPLWDVWVEAALRLARLLTAPLRFLLALMKKILRRGKKFFHFFRKCYIILFRKQRPRPAGRKGSSYGRS